MRRRQIQMPIRDKYCTDSGCVPHRMCLMTTSAIANMQTWQEGKTKETFETSIEDEDFQKVEEARRKADYATTAETARKADLERLKLEHKANEEVVSRVEEETRRVPDAAADDERLEKERLTNGAVKRAKLERLQKEQERERLETKKLAAASGDTETTSEHAHITKLQLIERKSNAPLQGGNVDDSADTCSLNRGYHNSDDLPKQHLPTSCQTNHEAGLRPEDYSQLMAVLSEEACGQFSPDMAGSSDGYKRYLSSFHKQDDIRRDSREYSTIASELTDASSVAELSSKLAEKKQLAIAHPEQPSFSEEDLSKSIPANTTSLQQTCIENVNFDNPIAFRSFLMNPFPKEKGIIQCSIKRNKGLKNALFPEYRIYLKSSSSKTETFLMTSKKRVGNKTSNYLISMSRNDHEKNSDSILGKLRSNFLGTEYMIYDNGKNPDYDDSYYDEKNNQDIRCELGAIIYGTNTSLGGKGPRKMKVCINKVNDSGNPLKIWQPNKDNERMVTCFKKKSSDINKLVCLQNKPPSWNDAVGAYVLNFSGRVTMASVKNFQLCGQDDEQNQIMQFGRIGKDEFSLDVQWPMSLFQAFAISLSSFDSKLGCD